MKRRFSLSLFFLLLVFSITASASVAKGGPDAAVPLFDVLGAEERAWFERALNEDRPTMLAIHADEGTLLWNADVYAPDLIRSCLKALMSVEVDVTREACWALDAMTMTYIFHMRDGSTKTFLFQKNMACVDPQHGPSDVLFTAVGAAGMVSFHAAGMGFFHSDH